MTDSFRAVVQFLAAILMLMGYGIIAVPTGIVSVELARASEKSSTSIRACHSCGGEFHAPDARYCMHCGENLQVDNE